MLCFLFDVYNFMCLRCGYFRCILLHSGSSSPFFIVPWLYSFNYFSFYFSLLRICQQISRNVMVGLCMHSSSFPGLPYLIYGVSGPSGRYRGHAIFCGYYYLSVACWLYCGTLFPPRFHLLWRDINWRCCYGGTHIQGCISTYTHLYYIPWFCVNKLLISVWECPGLLLVLHGRISILTIALNKETSTGESLHCIPSLVNRLWKSNLDFLHPISPRIHKCSRRLVRQWPGKSCKPQLPNSLFPRDHLSFIWLYRTDYLSLSPRRCELVDRLPRTLILKTLED